MNNIRYIDFARRNSLKINNFIVVFYCVGIVGFVLPISNALFLKLIPLALLLSFSLLVLFHESPITKKSLIAFYSIYILSLLIEIIGVNTGLIFGSYTYGNALGTQVFKTPLIIGVNWLFLVYTTAIVVDKIKATHFIKILLASAAMVIYDMVLEQVATALDMWYWSNKKIPLQNYAAWFILAVIFHSLVKVLHIKMKNKFAPILLICQFIFFVVLMLMLN